MSMKLRPFHLAFPVKDLLETKEWYVSNLGCAVGRESHEWIDFNFYGHQLVAHLSSSSEDKDTNAVDGHEIPIRHFGIVLKPKAWDDLAFNLKSNEIEFLIKPNTRFRASPGEQSTFFIKDPSGNVLEFKSFKDDKMIFKK